jgi:transcriptional regulator with XRE-family HTH domain
MREYDTTLASMTSQVAGRAARPHRRIEPSTPNVSTVEALSGSTLAERVRALRLARGMSQAELGGDRLTKAFISHVESGRSRLSPESSRYLAERLGVPVSVLDPDPPVAGNRVALLRATEAAIRGGQQERAGRLLDELAEYLHTPAALGEYHRLRGELHLLAGDTDSAVDSGLAAIDALPPGDASEVAARAHLLLGRAHQDAGRLAAALQYFSRGADLAARGVAPAAVLAHLHRDRGNTHLRLGDPHRALEAYMQAKAAAEDAEDLEQLAIAEMGLGVAARQRGDAASSISHAERAIALLERLEMRQLSVQLLHNIGHAHADRGETAEAREFQERAITAARAIRDRKTEGYSLERLAALELDSGDASAALARAREAAAAAQDIADVGLQALAAMVEAEAVEANGDRDAADRCVKRARQLAVDANAMERRMVLMRTGELLRSRGDHSGSADAFEEAARVGLSAG